MIKKVLKGWPWAFLLAVGGALCFPGVYRPIFEAQIGGGFGDATDGGMNIESNGDINSDGVSNFDQYEQDGTVYDLSLIGSGGSAHTIQDETTPLTQRANLNFTGAGVTVTDNAGTSTTEVTISGGGGGGIAGPVSSTDNALPRFDGTGGDTLQDSTVTVDDSGNIVLASGDTVDGRDLSTDGTKLDGIEAGADDNPTDAEIETAYNNQVAVMSQAEAEAGTDTTPKRVTAQRLSQAIAALGGSGGDPTYGSDAGASDSAVYVDAADEVGMGTGTPSDKLHLYSGSAGPRLRLQYYNAGGSGNVEGLAGAGSNSGTGFAWGTPTAIYANDGTYAQNDPSSDSQSQYLVSGTHAIALPDGAEVVGIEFDVSAFYIPISSPTDGYDVDVYAVKGGTILTGYDMASGTQWPNTETVRTYGGPTNLLGTTWTEAEVEASGFGLAFKVSVDADDVFFVDYIEARVYYTTGTAGDYVWREGIDETDGAFTVGSVSTVFMRMAYADGDTEFDGSVTAPFFFGDGSNLTNLPSGGGDVTGPVSSTDRAIATWNGTGGGTLYDNTVGIDASGNITLASGDTVDGRELSTDGAKLDGIEAGADDNPTDAEIATAYNGQVGIVSQATAEAGTDTTALRWTSERVRQAINAKAFTFTGDLSGTGTLGSLPAATIADDAVTPAKMSNAAEYTLLGRNAAGSGNRVDLSIADSMTMLGASYADLEPVDLTDGATLTCAYAPKKFYLYKVTIAGNRTVVTSGSTLVAGNRFMLLVTQDGSGGHTLDFDNTYFRFSTELPEPTIVTTAASQSLYMFMYLGGGKYSLIAYNQGF